MKTSVLAASALAVLAASLLPTGAKAQPTDTAPPLCAHADSINADAKTGVATASLTILAAPCTVTLQAIDKSGTGHGTISAVATTTFTSLGPSAIAVSLPCGVNSEADVIIGDPSQLYGPGNLDLRAAGPLAVGCTPPVAPPAQPPATPPAPPSAPPVAPPAPPVTPPPAPPVTPPAPPATPPAVPPGAIKPCPKAKPRVIIRWKTAKPKPTRVVTRTIRHTVYVPKWRTRTIYACPKGYVCMPKGQG